MESAQKVVAHFQLLDPEEKVGDAEEQLFAAQVDELERQWATPRWNGIKRPYSARDIVGKRGSLVETCASSLMARKLFNLIKKHQAAGSAITTRE